MFINATIIMSPISLIAPPHISALSCFLSLLDVYPSRISLDSHTSCLSYVFIPRVSLILSGVSCPLCLSCPLPCYLPLSIMTPLSWCSLSYLSRILSLILSHSLSCHNRLVTLIWFFSLSNASSALPIKLMWSVSLIFVHHHWWWFIFCEPSSSH